jgi:hypothetical protein
MTKTIQAQDYARLKRYKGNRKLKLDSKRIYELAQLHCTKAEIAINVGCSVETLTRRFSLIIEKGYEDSKESLRRWMMRAAKNGNVVMQIWLSKQLLGYKERQPDEAPTSVINVQINEVP